jgi:hypothetical protein
MKHSADMGYKKVKLCALLLLSLSLTGLRAQEAIPAVGGNAAGGGGSVSYSVGQVVYTTVSGTNGAVEQGVQQPYYITVVTGLARANGITLQCSAYPNPATDYVKLKIENFDTENLSYHLYDMGGKLLVNKPVEGSETSIDMRSLVIATYFLKIFQSHQEVKTFKIIKN